MTANTRSIRALVGSLALGAIAITGCSSDAKSAATTVAAETTVVPDTTAAAETTAAPDTTAAVETTEAAGGDTTVAAGDAAALTIKAFKFSALTATAGEPITVTNEDTAAHTVTADDGSFSVDVPPGGTATLTVDTAGTYAIHCKIHTSMTSSITIG